jgi:hypothetical protein
MKICFASPVKKALIIWPSSKAAPGRPELGKAWSGAAPDPPRRCFEECAILNRLTLSPSRTLHLNSESAKQARDDSRTEASEGVIAGFLVLDGTPLRLSLPSTQTLPSQPVPHSFAHTRLDSFFTPVTLLAPTPPFRTEQADDSSFTPVKWSACAERNLSSSSVFTLFVLAAEFGSRS